MEKTCEEVMTADPVFCVPSDSAQHAAQLMKELDVGAVPVCDDAQKLVGILTDRDLAVRVVAVGRDPETTPVGQIMTVELFTCRPSENVEQVFETMERQQIRRVPIVAANGRLIGIIAQADLATRLRIPGKMAEIITEISRPSIVAG
jgi:CBS domain-containing protein